MKKPREIKFPSPVNGQSQNNWVKNYIDTKLLNDTRMDRQRE